MNTRFLHELNYINWRKEATKEYLDKDTFNKLLSQFKEERTLAKSMTKREDFTETTYTYQKKGYWKYIFCYRKGKYVKYITQLDDTKLQQVREGTFSHDGVNSKIIVSAMFKKLNGCTELSAFGYCDRKIIHNCVPNPVYYINDLYKDKELDGVSKVDYSSNYPSNLLGSLPDWHTQKEVKGTVEPTEEYPFAYYIKSGHCAEYGVFDTHTWFTSKLCFRLFKTVEGEPKINVIPLEEDITILCKKSKYTFNEVVNELYEKKQNNEEIDGVPAKLVLNSFIGMMHRKDVEIERYRLDHVAAIALGRAAQKMIDKFEELTYLGIPVLQIIVDGIIYKSPVKIGVEKKALGALVQEVSDAKFIMRGINQYMFFDNNNNFIQERHGSFNDNIKTNTLQDIYEWRKSNETEI